MRPIELFRNELVSTRQEFIAAHPRPFLVYATDPASETTPVDARLLTIDRFVVQGKQAAPLRESIVAAELLARDPNERVITIGAGPSCDVVINNPSLSKQHAWFGPTATGWQIWDNDSVGGTQINARLLKPGWPGPLQSGDVITLGYVELTFLNAEAFYSLVKHLLR